MSRRLRTEMLEPETEAERAHSEGSRQARIALEHLRSAKKKSSLEETLGQLDRLQRQVKALGEQLPTLAQEPKHAPYEKKDCSGYPSQRRKCSEGDLTCKLPVLDPRRQR